MSLIPAPLSLACPGKRDEDASDVLHGRREVVEEDGAEDGLDDVLGVAWKEKMNIKNNNSSTAPQVTLPPPLRPPCAPVMPLRPPCAPVMDVTSGPLTVVHRKTMYVMKTPMQDATNCQQKGAGAGVGGRGSAAGHASRTHPHAHAPR